MKKIKWTLDIGYPGAERTGEIEVEDNATMEEIERACVEEAWDHLDLWWEVE